MAMTLRSTMLYVAVAALTAGCSVKARPTAMIPEQVRVEHQDAGSVLLETVGTHGDEILTATLIDGDDFAAALERAIVSSGVFKTVLRSSEADYKLYVEAKATAPAAGFNMTVRIGGAWRLTDQRSRKVLFDEFVTSSATKGVGDAFAGTTRLRLTTEAAAQAFIREGIERLSRRQLP